MKLFLYSVTESGLMQVPVIKSANNDNPFATSDPPYITLESHHFFGPKGSRWYEDDNYSTSKDLAIKQGIIRLTRSANTFLSRLQVITKTIKELRK